MAKKDTKKVVKKEVKAPAPKKEKKVKAPKSTIELVQFSVKATIPVMTFGNIQPEVVVKASTIEEAKAYVMPIIEDLFNQYVESPRDGSPKPTFASKANVTVTEKTVAPATSQKDAPTGASANTPKPAENTNLAKEIENTPERTEADLPPANTAVSQAYAKAEKAIGAVMSIAALDIIENQIKESTKLTPEEKPMLFTVLLKRKKELQ